MTIDLKRCPFCGGGAGFWNAGMFGEGYRVAVKCRFCAARVPSGTRETPEEAERVAAEGWNSRAERTCRARVKGSYLVCDRCGSEMWSTGGYCPGCGARLVEVVDDDE